MELKDILTEFLYECEVRNYSKRTIKTYKNNNALFHTYILKEFNLTEVEEIKTIHIKKYFKYLLQKD